MVEVGIYWYCLPGLYTYLAIQLHITEGLDSTGNLIEGTAREYGYFCGAGFILLMTQIDTIIVDCRISYLTIDGKITAVGF